MIARLRLLLAVLALALAPMTVPALSVAAPIGAVVAGGHDACAHPCDTGTAMDHPDSRCAAACGLSAAFAPLLVPAGVIVGPHGVVLREPLPYEGLLSATLWPPPVRPPRA